MEESICQRNFCGFWKIYKSLLPQKVKSIVNRKRLLLISYIIIYIYIHTPLGENTSGRLILHVKRILKVLFYEKFLFTVVKRNSLAIKMDTNTTTNNNKSNKYPVIVSTSPRNALRFFHRALLALLL